MFRFLGFLIGSLTSVLIILLVIGMPSFQLSDADATQDRYDAAIEMLRDKQREFEDVAGRLSDDIARVAERVDNEPEPAVVADEAVAVETIEAGPAEPSWYSFWNPFRSEIAANGFVAQLERVTGIDYRVVKVSTGVYEVAFAYRDDDERRMKLAQIAAATGLDLPDS